MKEQITEILDFFKFNQNYCALDSIEEIIDQLNPMDSTDQNYLRDICKSALSSKISKEFIEYLQSIDFDFSINWADEGSMANLFVGGRNNNVEVFKMLEEVGVDLTAVDKDGNNILHLLCLEKITGMNKELKQVDFAKQIITSENIEDLMGENYKGQSPLSLIITNDINNQKAKNMELITYLLQLLSETGVEVDDSTKFSLITETCNVANIELMKVIIGDNFDQTQKSNDGFSIAHFLTAHTNRATNPRDVTSLMEKKVEMLKILSEVDLTDDKGRTPLVYGMEHITPTTPAFWDVLIEKGVNVNATDNDGNCAIIYAAKKNLKAVESLVAVNGINLDAQNKIGETALITAIADSKVDAALALIKAGANTEITDNKGRDALSIAADKGQTKLVEALMGA